MPPRLDRFRDFLAKSANGPGKWNGSSELWGLFGRLDEAEAQEEKALSLMESVYGESHSDTAKIWSWIT